MADFREFDGICKAIQVQIDQAYQRGYADGLSRGTHCGYKRGYENGKKSKQNDKERLSIMTRKEASKIIKDGLEDMSLDFADEEQYEALTMAIKALGQKPKTGHWIGIDEEPHEVWECDHCGFVIDGSGCIEPYEYRDTYKYCPNCGAKMESEGE